VEIYCGCLNTYYNNAAAAAAATVKDAEKRWARWPMFYGVVKQS